MVPLVRVLGVLMTGLGVAGLLAPRFLRRGLGFWRTRGRIYLGGAIRLGLAGILLLAAPACGSPTIIAAVGIVSLVSGLSLFCLGFERLQAMRAWWQAQALSRFRLVGLVAAGMGLLILYGA